MLVEALILYGQDRVTYHLGYLVESPGAGAVLRSYQGGDEGAVSGDHDRRLGLLRDCDVELPGLVPVAAGGDNRQDQQHG